MRTNIFYLGTDTNGVRLILYACLAKVLCQKPVESKKNLLYITKFTLRISNLRAEWYWNPGTIWHVN